MKYNNWIFASFVNDETRIGSLFIPLGDAWSLVDLIARGDNPQKAHWVCQH